MKTSKSAVIKVEYDGQVVELNIEDVTGVEARDFRQQVGVSFMKAFTELERGDLDLEPIAGLLWIVKRRDKPEIEYEDVLGNVSFGSIVDDDKEPPPDPPA